MIGEVELYGFTNKLYVQVLNLQANQYYGVLMVIAQHGTKTVALTGYDSTPTDTSGDIKTYKHQNGDKYDYQFVFPSSYEHGVFILAGSVAKFGNVLIMS